jgi:hypothetical protein
MWSCSTERESLTCKVSNNFTVFVYKIMFKMLYFCFRVIAYKKRTSHESGRRELCPKLCGGYMELRNLTFDWQQYRLGRITCCPVILGLSGWWWTDERFEASNKEGQPLVGCVSRKQGRVRQRFWLSNSWFLIFSIKKPFHIPYVRHWTKVATNIDALF